MDRALGAAPRAVAVALLRGEALVAERLAQAGCPWNSFVIVAQPGTLGHLIRRAVPRLAEAFAPLASRLGTPWEEDAARPVYAGLPATDFSKQVLQAVPAALAVLPVSGFEWNDLGDPVRVLAIQERTPLEARLGVSGAFLVTLERAARHPCSGSGGTLRWDGCGRERPRAARAPSRR
jgi:hypothetical protein